MATIEVKVPDIGGQDVPVIELLVKVGDVVRQDQGLVTLESDKATMEVPASAAGVVRELKVGLGDKLSQGSVVAILETEAAAVTSASGDEAPARTQGDGPTLSTLLLGGLGVVVLALMLVYLLKPGWLGLETDTAPSREASANDTPAAPAPATTDSAPAPAAASSPGASTATPPSAHIPSPNPSTPPAPAGAPAQASVPESPKSPLRLVVAPTGRCWVQVTADGQMRVAREVSAGERITVDAAERLQVVVGDPGNLAYELNGRPGKSLGGAGAVARATILPATVAQFQAP